MFADGRARHAARGGSAPGRSADARAHRPLSLDLRRSDRQRPGLRRGARRRSARRSGRGARPRARRRRPDRDAGRPPRRRHPPCPITAIELALGAGDLEDEGRARTTLGTSLASLGRLEDGPRRARPRPRHRATSSASPTTWPARASTRTFLLELAGRPDEALALARSALADAATTGMGATFGCAQAAVAANALIAPRRPRRGARADRRVVAPRDAARSARSACARAGRTR